MKAISFFGTGKYSEVTYVHGEQECYTRLFPHALTRFFKPDELLICLTPDAKIAPRGEPQTHFEALCDIHQREGLITPQEVAIPNGGSTEELWEMFTIMAQQLTRGDEVVFDITHAFRSLPMLVFLAAAYLRVAKEVTLRAIVYGAYEARDKVTDRAPVFDLTPFLSLLDWTTATEQFLQTGNAQALAIRLQEAAPHTGAGALSESLRDIAQGLHMLRPLDVLKRAAQVHDQIDKATLAINRLALPFGTLLERIDADYGNFGLREPERVEHSAAVLLRLLDLAKWYLDKEQIVQALAIAREWLPTLLCHWFKLDIRDGNYRLAMEELLNHDEEQILVKVQRQDQRCTWQNVPHGARLRSLWRTGLQQQRRGPQVTLTSLRNDVLHAGFRKAPRRPAQILTETRAILDELRAIAALWKLEERA